MLTNDSDDVPGYWCVVCGRFLPETDGVIVHDDLPHHSLMDFEEEERMQ